MTKIKHVGIHATRTKENKAEKVFAESWLEENEGKGRAPGILAILLESDKNEVTARDAQVAATVVQWLGSPVGQHWLAETQRKMLATK